MCINAETITKDGYTYSQADSSFWRFNGSILSCFGVRTGRSGNDVEKEFKLYTLIKNFILTHHFTYLWMYWAIIPMEYRGTDNLSELPYYETNNLDHIYRSYWITTSMA